VASLHSLHFSTANHHHHHHGWNATDGASWEFRLCPSWYDKLPIDIPWGVYLAKNPAHWMTDHSAALSMNHSPVKCPCFVTSSFTTSTNKLPRIGCFILVTQIQQMVLAGNP